MSVVDSINEVSNTAPIAFQDLTEGLRRVSGVMAQQGMDLQQTIGLLTAGYGQLRDIEGVSAGLITIANRLRGVSDSGDEIEGLVPKLQKAFKDIAGIDIEAPGGGLRDIYSIMKDMSAVFPTLTEQEQQFLNELASGSRQSKVLQAITSNWQDVEKAVKSASSATGSASIENIKYMDSIDGRTQKLSSTFQKLASSVVNSGLIKGLLAMGEGLLRFAALGDGAVAKTILLTASIGGLVAVAKSSTVTKMFDSFKQFFKDIGNLPQKIGEINEVTKLLKNDDLKNITKALENYTSAQKINNLIERQAIDNADGLSVAQTEQLLAIQGLDLATRQSVASKIQEAAALKQSIANTKEEIRNKEKLISVLQSEAEQRRIAASISQLNESLGRDESRLTELENEFGDLKLERVGYSKGAIVGTALISGIFASLSSYSAAKQAQSAGEAFGSWISNGITSAVSGALSGFMSGGIIGALVGGVVPLLVSGASALIGYSSSYEERLSQNLKDITEEYNNTASEIESLESQLAKVNKQIDELIKKGTPTLTDSTDLERLQQENSELERRIVLTRLIEKQQAQEKNRATTQSAESFSRKNLEAGIDVTGDIATVTPPHFESLLDAYEKLTSQIQEMNMQILSGKEIDVDLYDHLKNALKKTKNELVDLAAEAENLSSSFTGTDADALSWQAILDDIVDSILRLDKTENQLKLDNLNKLLGSSEYEDEVAALKNLSAAGILDEADIAVYAGFNQQLKNLGITAEEAAAELNKIYEVDNPAKDFKLIIDELINKTTLLNNAMLEQAVTGNISAATYKTIYNSGEDYEGLVASTADGLFILVDETNEYIDSLVAQAMQQSVLNDYTEEQIKLLQQYFSQINDLNSKLDSIKSSQSLLTTMQKEFADFGKFSIDTIIELISKYPQLENVVVKYLSKKATEEDIFAEIERMRSADISNYKKTVAAKLALNNEFYEATIKGNSAIVNKFKIIYGIDLTSFENLAGAKLSIDNDLRARILSGWIEIYGSIEQAQRAIMGSGSIMAADQQARVTRYLQELVDAGTATDDQKDQLARYKEMEATREALLKLEKAKAELEKVGGVEFEDILDLESFESSDGSGSAVDEYVADIDLLYAATKRLTDIQTNISRTQAHLDLAGNISEQIEYHKQIVELYKKEQDALHNLAEERRKIVAKNISVLQSQGFVIEYDPTNNDLFIQNIEHINDLTGSTTEETNELRKSYEDLVKSTIEYVDANKETSARWWDVLKNIREEYEQIYDIQQSAYKNAVTLLENQFRQIEGSFDISGMKRNADEQITYYKQIMDAAHEWADELRSSGYSEMSDEISSASQTWWDAFYKIESLNQQVYDDVLEQYDNYISRHTELNQWGVDTEIEALHRKKGFIEQSYHDGLITYRRYVEDMNNVAAELYDAELSAQQAYVNGVLKILDKEREALEKQQEYYERQKSNYETTVSTVVSFIDEQIAALQKENTELDKQLRLQQALEDLEKAKSQRTKRIYREDVGFVWEADQDAINSAQSTFDELQKQYSLEDQILSWENYKKAWQDTVDSYEENQDRLKTIQFLGSAWEQDILNKRTDYLDNFRLMYGEYCDELNEDHENSTVSQINRLNDLSEQWQNSIDDITDTTAQYEGVLAALANFEAANYETRLGLLKSFIDESKAALQGLRDEQKRLINEVESSYALSPSAGSDNLNNGNSFSGQYSQPTVEQNASYQNGFTGGNDGIYWYNGFAVKYDPNVDYQALLEEYERQGAPPDVLGLTELQRNLKIEKENLPYAQTYKYKNVYGYKEGGVVDYTGIANVHGSKQKPELVLNNADVAKVYNLIHKTGSLGSELEYSAEQIKSMISELSSRLVPVSNTSVGKNILDEFKKVAPMMMQPSASKKLLLNDGG